MRLELGKHDPEMISRRSIESINSGIRDIMGTQFPGPWEKEQLRLLKAERDRRADAKQEGRAAA